MSFSSGMGSSSRSRKTRSSCSLSFLAWWVMLRASTPVPSVQPLTVWARIDGRAGPCARPRRGRRRRACGSRGRRGAGALISSSVRSRDQRQQARVGAEEVLADVGARSRPSTSATRRRATRPCAATRTPSTSRASSSSHSRPQMTLMTFQPAPRKTDSSSWMILPLPRTGPSRRCRLQLTTKVEVVEALARGDARASRAPPARPSRRRRGTPRRGCAMVSLMPRWCEVAVEARLVDRGQRRRGPSRPWGTPRSRASGAGAGTSERPWPGTTSWRKWSSWSSREAALEEGAGVDAGRGVALEEDLVAHARRRPCRGRSG